MSKFAILWRQIGAHVKVVFSVGMNEEDLQQPFAILTFLGEKGCTAPFLPTYYFSLPCEAVTKDFVAGLLCVDLIWRAEASSSLVP